MDEEQHETPIRVSEAEERKFSRRKALQGAAVLGAAVTFGPLLASCGSSPSGSTSASPAVGSSPVKGGDLLIGVGQGSAKDTLDAHLSISEPDIARQFELYEGLQSRDKDYKVINALAEEVTTSADARVWTARLRTGLEFHNGKPVTADDVIFSFNRIMNPKKPGGGIEMLKGLTPAGLKKIDERTVQFTLARPNAIFDSGLSYYQNTIVPVDYDPNKPIGTGAFKFTSWRPGIDSDFARFDNYWGQVAYVDTLKTISFPDDTARYNALTSGDVHMISNLPGAQVPTVKADSGLGVLNSPSGGWLPITMRVDVAPFNDVRVRQAMRLVVDRPQMLQVALNDLGTIGNDMYAPLDPVYASDLPQRVQDLEKAKSLLKQAGQSDLTVELVALSSYVGLVEAAQVLREQAKQIGVTIKVRVMDESGFWANYLNWPFSEDWWYTRDYLPQTTMSTLPKSLYNETHWADPEFTKLVTEAIATADFSKRKELCHAAQVIEYDNGGYLIWGLKNQVDAFARQVQGTDIDKSGIPLMSWHFNKVWLT